MRSKIEWRRRARLGRSAALVDADLHRAGLKTFLASPAVSGWVVGYRAMPDELDLSSVMADAALGPFALTRTPAQGMDLTVHRADGPTERHRYGFDQPTVHAPLVIDDDIGVVLVPGLAFDRSGHRLGRGAGYYDRFLARLPLSVLRIGVTGGYVVAELPTEAHDVVMTHLAGAFGVASVPMDPEA